MVSPEDLRKGVSSCLEVVIATATMSLDIDWSLLDTTLTCHLVSRINSVLRTTTLPDMLGPMSVQACELGDEPPELTIASIQDVWPEFLEESDDEDNPAVHTAPPDAAHPPPIPKPHLISRSRAPSSVASSPIWSSWPARPASTATGIGLGYAGLRPSWSATNGTASPFSGSRSVVSSPLGTLGPPYGPASNSESDSGAYPTPRAPPRTLYPTSNATQSDKTTLSAQVISHMRWRSTSVRLELRTSLLVNEPCPAFMELPLVLTVTGFVLDAGLVLAFDQDRHEAHISLIDAAHVEAAADARQQRPGSSRRRGPVPDTILSNPSQIEFDPVDSASQNDDSRRSRIRRCPPPMAPPSDPLSSASQNTSAVSRSTLGQRFLPFLALESSVGDDRNHKHVLRNVGKVEQFVIQLVRGLVVDELAFPNFYTFQLASDSSAN